MTIDLILGTAGHIDHGKTSLTKALTGVDTDRLPEEKKRGITIELGFAELQLGDFRLGIVDVPGHERFVRNMLAGATGMDLVMLVVAADDSVKQQTLEHLDILRLLDHPAGVIALTKCDLADPDWIDLVEEEVRDLVTGTFLENATIVRTSAHTGEGIEQLRDALTIAAQKAATARQSAVEQPFRMAIDRVFTIAGHGTVVTGSVSQGRLSLGDELRIEPLGKTVRVRGVQNHDRSSEEVQRGQRAAINLAGVHHDEIGRGQELSAQGYLVPSRLLSAQIHLLPSCTRPLKSRARVRVHVGTAEVLASVVLLDRERLEPGESAPVQLFLSEPAVATWNQPLVLRSESPVATIGGGHVLDPVAEKIRKPTPAVLGALADLQSDETLRRANASLYFAGLRGWKPADLARAAGIEDVPQAFEQLQQSGDLCEVVISPTRTINVHRQVFAEAGEQIEKTLVAMHAQNPLRSMLEISPLAQRFSWLGERAVFDAIIKHLEKAKKLRRQNNRVALAGHGPQLSAGERKLLAHLVEKFRNAGLQPPTSKECQETAPNNRTSVPQLIALAVADGDLVEIGPDFFLHVETENEMREKLDEALGNGAGLKVSDVREILSTTRKYAVPYLEFLDRLGWTRRDGDFRYRNQ